MKKLDPIKSLGQNFLLDQNIAKKIVDLLEPYDKRLVIEIGPGSGSLTKLLIEKAYNFIAIEIDKRSVELLNKEFPNLRLINEDFLKINLSALVEDFNETIRIVGNIPYNITSPILFKLFEYNKIIDDAVLMVQYEVAKRIAAKEKSKDFSILSVASSFFFDVKFCFEVSPNVFYPKPKVYSAVIKLTKKESKPNVDPSLFISIVKACFNKRRKTLKNSLKSSIFKDLINLNLSVDLNKRAEELSFQDFVQLAIAAQTYLKF